MATDGFGKVTASDVKAWRTVDAFSVDYIADLLGKSREAVIKIMRMPDEKRIDTAYSLRARRNPAHWY